MDDPHDWDSLSARVRKQRRQGHRTLMQRQRGYNHSIIISI